VALLLQVVEVAEFLEGQMGLAKGWLTGVPCSLYLYVSSSRRVLGCMVTESIKEAFRVVPAKPHQLLSSSSAAPARSSASGKSDSAAAEASTLAAAAAAAAVPTSTPSSAPATVPPTYPAPEQPAWNGPARGGGESVTVDRSRRVKAVCGVRVMWTSAAARRRGVATKMLNCARAHVVRGYVVPRAGVAFTQPTADGAAFIQRYTGTPEFLVY
jgi:N-acetyltransferase